jgi:hypothetical protein
MDRMPHGILMFLRNRSCFLPSRTQTPLRMTCPCTNSGWTFHRGTRPPRHLSLPSHRTTRNTRLHRACLTCRHCRSHKPCPWPMFPHCLPCTAPRPLAQCMTRGERQPSLHQGAHSLHRLRAQPTPAFMKTSNSSDTWILGKICSPRVCFNAH